VTQLNVFFLCVCVCVCDTDNLFTKVESTSKKLVEISTKNCCCCCCTSLHLCTFTTII